MSLRRKAGTAVIALGVAGLVAGSVQTVRYGGKAYDKIREFYTINQIKDSPLSESYADKREYEIYSRQVDELLSGKIEEFGTLFNYTIFASLASLAACGAVALGGYMRK